jgi:hypothetical protein
MAIRSLALPIWLRHSRIGPVFLSEIAAVHLPFGLRIERDPISRLGTPVALGADRPQSRLHHAGGRALHLIGL